MAACQRYLEQSVAELAAADAVAAPPSATRRGVENALSFVADVLARHAVAPGPLPPIEPTEEDGAR